MRNLSFVELRNPFVIRTLVVNNQTLVGCLIQRNSTLFNHPKVIPKCRFSLLMIHSNFENSHLLSLVIYTSSNLSLNDDKTKSLMPRRERALKWNGWPKFGTGCFSMTYHAFF